MWSIERLFNEVNVMLKPLSLIIAIVLLAASASFALAQEVAMGLSADEIATFPAPTVQPLVADETVLRDRFYQRVTQAVDIYDAPNGNVIGTLAAGFNFVTTRSDENGWTQINPNKWVKTEFLRPAAASGFAGVLINEEMPYPVAWVLVDVVPSITPGAEPPEEGDVFRRYTLVNLYSTVEVDGWRWYQVGVNQWIEQKLVAKILPVERPADVDTTRWVSVDLYEQVAIAYEGTTPVFATLVASGLPEWSTNEGLFNIYVHYERTVMSGAEGQPDFYYLEEVPWTMYFDNDIGLHGTYWHDGFGYRHSHGCVNLSITDSKWLFDWLSPEYNAEEMTGAAVYVYSSGEYK
jgi:hypothetical protein